MNSDDEDENPGGIMHADEGDDVEDEEDEPPKRLQ